MEFIAWHQHIHEHEMVFGLVVEVCSCSASFLAPQQYTRSKNVRTLEHWVFAHEKLIHHPKRKIVPSSVSNVRSWP